MGLSGVAVGQSNLISRTRWEVQFLAAAHLLAVFILQVKIEVVEVLCRDTKT